MKQFLIGLSISLLLVSSSAYAIGALKIIDGGTGATTAQGARTNILPTQTGNTGKALLTNGSDAYWGEVSTGGGSVATTTFGAVIYPIDFIASGLLNQTSTNLPGGTQALGSTLTASSTVTYNSANLYRAESFYLTAVQSASGLTGQYLKLQCSTNNGTSWIDAGNSNSNLALNSTTPAPKNTVWATLDAGCRDSNALLRLVSVASATSSPSFRNIKALFRLSQGAPGETLESTADMTFISTLVGQAITNQAVATSTVSYSSFDTTNTTQYRLFKSQTVGSVSVNNPRLFLECSSDGTTYYSASSYSNYLSISATGQATTSWFTLSPTCQGKMTYRLSSIGGNASADPAFTQLIVQFNSSYQNLGTSGGTDTNWVYTALTNLLTTSTSTTGIQVNGTSTLATTSMTFDSTIGHSTAYLKIKEFVVTAGDLIGTKIPLLQGFADLLGGGSASNVGIAVDGGFFIRENTDAGIDPTIYFTKGDGNPAVALQYATTTGYLNIAGQTKANITSPLSVTVNVDSNENNSIDITQLDSGNNATGELKLYNANGHVGGLAVFSPNYSGLFDPAGTFLKNTIALFSQGDKDIVIANIGTSSAIYFKNGTSSDAMTIKDNMVGIGLTPTTELEVNGTASSTDLFVANNASTTNMYLSGAFKDTTKSIGTNGQVLTSTGTSTKWATNTNNQTPWASIIDADNYDLINVGKIGLGTNDPQEAIDVRGNIVVTGAIYGASTSPADAFYLVRNKEGRLALAEGGQESYFGGDLGIGTTTPDSKFVVDNGTTEEGGFFFTNLFKAGFKYIDSIFGDLHTGGFGYASSTSDGTAGLGAGVLGVAENANNYGIIGRGANGGVGGIFISDTNTAPAIIATNIDANGFSFYSATGLNFLTGTTTIGQMDEGDGATPGVIRIIDTDGAGATCLTTLNGTPIWSVCD